MIQNQNNSFINLKKNMFYQNVIDTFVFFFYKIILYILTNLDFDKLDIIIDSNLHSRQLY